MNITNYLEKIKQHHESGHATEHTYRGNLAGLIEDIVQDVHVTNEPRRQDCGAPDYILTKKGIPIGFIEAKNIGDKDLEGLKENKDQFDRYKESLNNLIFTDYINFYFYRDGNLVAKIDIAKIEDKSIKPLPNNFEIFEDLIKDFSEHIGQSIKNPKQLSEMMAGKARLLSDIIGKALAMDVNSSEKSTLNDQFLAFKKFLIHDITPSDFADVYAQTIAYGMFAARLHDPTLETFSRQEAAELIPKSNPFLRKLFGYIAGPDIDDRIKWVVDNLSEIFLACNVVEILKDYGKAAKMEDPIIHFYETFLSEYDPKLRKQRGVWYTPKPIVNFIIRAVDDILKTDFDLSQGIADTKKIKIKRNSQTPDKRSATGYKQIEQEVHKVQILDPATGTGTFLAEVINNIYQKFHGQQGIWSNYVENDLLPRLNGFELLMASYAMAHLKLDLLLRQTGFKPTSIQRFNVYLTNSLEEYHPDTGTLFASWLSDEANKANYIKRDTPVMCVVGNPPYAVSSSNKGNWINDLTSVYKKGLEERSYNALSDDYVKFIRYGQHFIEKNDNGILAFITNNSFLDGIVFRKMRESLLETFDKIYILDLHGNSRKNEVCPDGSEDSNVFYIQQGVSINIFIKTGRKKKQELGKLFQYDLYGKRQFKYDFLNNNDFSSMQWSTPTPTKPNYFFVNKDFGGQDIYDEGFSIDKLFKIKAAGIKTHKDKVVIGYNKKELKDQIDTYLSSNNVQNNLYEESKVKSISYRPFDNRVIYFDTNIVERHRKKQIKHSFYENTSLLSGRQTKNIDACHFFISNTLSEMKTAESSTGSYHFHLYTYHEANGQQTFSSNEERRPNLNLDIIKEIEILLGLIYTDEKESTADTFSPIDVLDYIYATLYSPKYREKYSTFLKIDYAKIPYPKNKKTFWQLVNLGSEMRQIHLLESPLVEQFITQYPEDGDNKIEKSQYIDDKVFINKTQYFDSVPKIAWELNIGGYKPAQKWLKDRKGRTLEFGDILQYQKIIVALSETDRLMKEIDDLDWFR